MPEELEQPCAWMACHFSAYGTGLSNLPQQLPAGSVVIVNDRTPIRGHDPILICKQLTQLAEALSLGGILLDLQRPDVSQTRELVRFLVHRLPCPVAVTAPYAQDLDCPVFLDPPPPSVLPKTYLTSWQDRQVWLEAATVNQVLTLTKTGCDSSGLLPWEEGRYPHEASELFCRYRMELESDRAVFTFSRDREMLSKLLASLDGANVALSIGLFQQLHSIDNLL